MKKRKLEISTSSPIRGRRKGGQILIENIIFIVLNLIFLSMIVLFVFSRTTSTSLLEEKYAKEIALMIDSAQPGMTIHLNMEDALSAAGNFGANNIVSVSGNNITVKLSDKTGFTYSFFNNVKVSAHPDTTSNPVKEYYFVVEKNE